MTRGMGSETLLSTCYILSDESSEPFTLRVTGTKINSFSEIPWSVLAKIVLKFNKS